MTSKPAMTPDFWKDFVRTWAGRGEDLGYGDLSSIAGQDLQVVPVIHTAVECVWTREDGGNVFVELKAKVAGMDQGWLIQEVSSLRNHNGEPHTDEKIRSRFAPGMILDGDDVEIRRDITANARRDGCHIIADGNPLCDSQALERSFTFWEVERNAGFGGIPARIKVIERNHGAYVMIEQVPDAHFRAVNRDWTLVYTNTDFSDPEVLGTAHYQHTFGLRGADTDVAFPSLQIAACIHDTMIRGCDESPDEPTDSSASEPQDDSGSGLAL